MFSGPAPAVAVERRGALNQQRAQVVGMFVLIEDDDE